MKYQVGDVIQIKEDLQYNGKKKDGKLLFEQIYPIEVFFKGYEVTITEVYPECGGYGVKYLDSRKFFVHESHIEEV